MHKKLLYPPVWLILVLCVLSAAALVLVFSRGENDTPLSYAVYVLSAYSLTVLCLYCVRVLPGQLQRAKQKIYDHPVGNRYMTDAAFKTKVSLYLSLAVNLAFSVFKLTAGIVYASWWLGTIAVYYLLLSLLRFLLLRYMHRDGGSLQEEWRQYRLCSIWMLVLNVSLSGIVYLMVREDMGYSYPGVMIFAVAAYTFYSVTMSVIDMVKYRKFESPVLSAAKAVRLVSALVSLLALETAMLAQFGQDDSLRGPMVTWTGSAVWAAVMTMSISMAVRANRELRIKEHTNGREK